MYVCFAGVRWSRDDERNVLYIGFGNLRRRCLIGNSVYMVVSPLLKRRPLPLRFHFSLDAFITVIGGAMRRH